jgi:hypothetical protein
MTLGTMVLPPLAIHRMEQNAQRPDGGPIVVTGASGGVGASRWHAGRARLKSWP